MNISEKNNLLKMAIEEGCKTIGELALFLKRKNLVIKA
jgi:hypothetical protein